MKGVYKNTNGIVCLLDRVELKKGFFYCWCEKEKKKKEREGEGEKKLKRRGLRT